MTKTLLGSLCATVAFLAISPAARAEPEALPAWCNDPDVRRMGSVGVDSALGEVALNALPDLVAASCIVGGEPAKRRGELVAARAKWNQRLGITDAEWTTDVIPWVVAPQWKKASPTLAHDPKQAWSALGPIDQYATITAYGSTDPHYLVDALGARLTETGRFAYVQLCLARTLPVEWALCQADALALDEKKLADELRGDPRKSGYERMVIRLAVDAARPQLAARAKAIEALTAKDPGYATLFALAADTRKAFPAKVDAKLLELVAAMDDARVTNSSKAYAGCDDRTWPALAAAVSAIPAKRFAELKTGPVEFLYGAIGVLINDPNAYLAAVAHHTCHATKPDVLVRFLAGSLERWPGFRGPRTAALTAIATTPIALDDRDARLEVPRTQRWYRGDGMLKGAGAGPVSAVKRGDATTVVEFVKKLRKEKVCADWKDTNQIVQFDGSGNPIYGYRCLKYETLTVNEASAPRTVNSRYAAGIKKGTVTAIVEDVVVAVWPKAGAAPTAVFGAPVK